MADTDLIPFGAAIAGDILSAFNLPGGSTLSFVTEKVLAKKRREVTEILITEASSGRHGPIDFEKHDVDPLIDMILRLSKAVAEGAARENLILLAQIIAGLKKNRAFDPDRFRRWCKIVEGLTRDELLVVGFASQVNKEVDTREDPIGFNSKLREKLRDAKYEFGEIEALLTAVASTGLLSSVPALGGLSYQPTPWLGELAVLADIEARKDRLYNLR